ncbi:MAG: RNA polymerase sigma factor [Candidatus Moraniibacteriota bacterium]
MINLEECEKKEDSELVSLSLANQEYFYCIIARYERVIFHYILRISNSSKEDAEDILQEVFMSVYENLNEFDKSLKFSSWIYRIAHNKTISAWRKMKTRPKTIWTEEDQNLFNLISSDEDILGNLEKKCSAKEVQSALGELDERYREVLVLKFLEDKDYKEISDILKKPMGTVATLINRAKGQLREKLNNLEIK